MIRDTFLLRLITNFMVMASVLIVDEKVPCLSLPKMIKFKHKRQEIKEVQELEEI